VTQMDTMFGGANAFNQDLCSWHDKVDLTTVSLFSIFSPSGCDDTSEPTPSSSTWCRVCEFSSTPTPTTAAVLPDPTNAPTPNPTTTALVPGSTSDPTSNPTTADPVPDPTSPPSQVPSGSENGACESGQILIEVSLTTDKYYYETSWEVFDSLTGAVVLRGGDYEGPAGKTFVEGSCVPDIVCYQLLLHDEFGDGMGNTGSYSVSVDGTEVISSSPGDFNSQWKNYDINCASELTQPEVIPAENGGSDCGPDEILMQIELTTDAWFYETSWALTNSFTNGIYMAGGVYSKPYETYIQRKCLPNSCYYLSIFDTFGDGMISDQGYYTVQIDGSMALTSNKEFDSHWINHPINCDAAEQK
jgi:hypothetical protein